jgi:hypothetical protein
VHPVQTPAAPAAFIACGEEFRDVDPAGPLPQIPNGVHCLVDFRVPAIDFGHDSGDSASMPGNDRSFAPLDATGHPGIG